MSFSQLNFGQLLHELNNVDTKHKIRFYEKINKRILLTNYGIYFNQLCLNEGLYPIFTNIYINKIFLQLCAPPYIVLHYRSFCINIPQSYLLYNNILCANHNGPVLSQFDKFTIVTQAFIFKFYRAHICMGIICKKY